MARENEVSKIFIISPDRTKSKLFKSNGERVHLTDACQRKEMREFHWLWRSVTDKIFKSFRKGLLSELYGMLSS